MPLYRAKPSKIFSSLDIPSQQAKKIKQRPHFRPNQNSQQFKKIIQNCLQQNVAKQYQQDYSIWDGQRRKKQDQEKMEFHKLKEIIILMASGQPIELCRCPYKSDSSDQLQRSLYQLLNLTNESKFTMFPPNSDEALPSDQYLAKFMNEESNIFVKWTYLHTKHGISQLQKNNYRLILLDNSFQRQFSSNKLSNPPSTILEESVKIEEFQDALECRNLMQQQSSFKNGVPNPDKEQKMELDLLQDEKEVLVKSDYQLDINDAVSFTGQPMEKEMHLKNEYVKLRHQFTRKVSFMRVLLNKCPQIFHSKRQRYPKQRLIFTKLLMRSFRNYLKPVRKSATPRQKFKRLRQRRRTIQANDIQLPKSNYRSLVQRQRINITNSQGCQQDETQGQLLEQISKIEVGESASEDLFSLFDISIHQMEVQHTRQKEAIKQISRYFAKIQFIDEESFLKLFDDLRKQEQDIILRDILKQFGQLYRKSENYLKKGLILTDQIKNRYQKCLTKYKRIFESVQLSKKEIANFKDGQLVLQDKIKNLESLNQSFTSLIQQERLSWIEQQLKSAQQAQPMTAPNEGCRIGCPNSLQSSIQELPTLRSIKSLQGLVYMVDSNSCSEYDQVQLNCFVEGWEFQVISNR